MICSKCGGETGGSNSTTTRHLCTCNTDRNPKDETDYKIGYKYGYDNGYKAGEKSEAEKSASMLRAAEVVIEELKYQMKTLQADFRKCKCCGSCKWWGDHRLCGNKVSKYYWHIIKTVTLRDEKCDEWEVIE